MERNSNIKYFKNKEEFFTIILLDKINKFLKDEIYELEFPTFSREELIEYLSSYSYKENNQTTLNSNYNKTYDENINYNILELDNYYNYGDIIEFKNVYSVNSYSEFFDEINPLIINKQLHYSIREKVIRQQLSNQVYDYNNSMINDELFKFSDYKINEYKYLFRTCSLGEIDSLINNEYIIPINNNKFLSLSKSSDHALGRFLMEDGIRFDYDKHRYYKNAEYLVIYNRNIIYNQNNDKGDLYEIPETYLEYLKLPIEVRNHVGKYFEDLEYRQQELRKNFYNFKYHHPQIKQQEITLQNLNEINEHEIVIKRIKLENNILHNIFVLPPSDDNFRFYNGEYFDYYENYNKLKLLIINKKIKLDKKL